MDATPMDSRTGEQLTWSQIITGAFWEESHNPISVKVLAQGETTSHPPQQVFQVTNMMNHNIKKRLNIHKAFLHFRIWTTPTIHSGTCLQTEIKQRINIYLQQLGVLSLQSLSMAINYAFDAPWCIYVETTMYNIQMQLY
jgi:hypothetical protein